MITVKSALSNIKKVKKISTSFRLDEDLKNALEIVSKFNKVSSAELLEAILNETDIVKQSNSILKNIDEKSLFENDKSLESK